VSVFAKIMADKLEEESCQMNNK